MNPKVSVIVPVYNVEKYLEKCVDSIIKQSLKEIEIILVDDGSTDKSPQILDKYRLKDNRIIVIHKENGGQGSARNEGLKISRGEYIGFVDSDDWIDIDMYEKLYRRAKSEEADIAVCNRRLFKDNGEVETIVNVGEKIHINYNISVESITNFIIEYLFYPYTVSSCNKIYSYDLFENNQITFKDVKEVGSEDALLNYQTLLNSGKIVSVNQTYYNQLAREGSTTRQYKSGSMKRTANLIKSIYLYSEKSGRKDVGDIVAPLVLLFFQQWNYNYIKSYGMDNLKYNICEEHRQVGNNFYFKKAERALIFNTNVLPYIKEMGFGLKGRLFIKTYMLCDYCSAYKIAAFLRTKVQSRERRYK